MNIEDDLVQEICNRLGKEIVQRMGANKTIHSISKACKAVGGIKASWSNSTFHQESIKFQQNMLSGVHLMMN